MNILLDYNLKEIEEIVVNLGQPKFRATQIFQWCQKGRTIGEMSNLPKNFVIELEKSYVANGVKIIEVLESKKDDVKKFIFGLMDNNVIEGVLMGYSYGNTICISTQVGCRMNCAFCASGIDGLVRNLSAGEILGQVVSANKYIGNGEREIKNVVLMGSGEPLDNYDNVIKFLSLVGNDKGLNIGMRNISLSTCGICDKIYELADTGLNVTLTISLHAPNDKLRDEIMPINKRYSIKELLKAVRYYFNKTGRRIILEYTLIKGKNDSEQCAEELAGLLRGFAGHINIINLNPVKEKGLLASGKENVNNFINVLNELNVSVTERRIMGRDIEGACGQLRRKYLEDKNKTE